MLEHIVGRSSIVGEAGEELGRRCFYCLSRVHEDQREREGRWTRSM
jgi:hypothetical protein